MRDRMERFVLLPFSVGCVSESSVAVAVQRQPPQRRSSWSKPAAAEIKNTSNAISLIIFISFVFWLLNLEFKHRFLFVLVYETNENVKILEHELS